MDHFKQHFRETLELALTVYPEADVALDGSHRHHSEAIEAPILVGIAPSRGAIKRLFE